MPKVFNQKKTSQKKKDSPISEYSWNTTEDLAILAGLEDVSCNIRLLDKGKISYPYHFHHNAEELFVFISGEGELRTPEGIIEVKAGDIAFFEKGESGAHQVVNNQDTPLVYLDLRTINKIDICEYPDTGKMNILPEREIFYKGEHTTYFEGEENILQIWNKLKAGK